MRVRISSVGLASPPKVESAADISTLIGRSEQWIVERTGVLRRHVADVPFEELAAEAARAALASGPPPDLLINASVTARQLLPDSSAFVLKELGLDGVPGFSVHSSCLSFLVALHNAAALINAGSYKRILIVSAERATLGRNPAEPESAALLGDGAASAIIEPTPAGESSEFIGWRMTTFPKGSDLTEIRGFGMHRHPNDKSTQSTDALFHMNGPAVFKFTVRRVVVFVNRLLSDHGLSADDIDLVIPHQASGPALQVIERLGFPSDRIQNIVGEYGNCVAASLPMALASAHATGKLKRGDRVLLLGTGAGLSIAGAVVRW